MARKRRGASPASTPVTNAAPLPAASAASLPREPAGDGRAAMLLALMMFVAPTVGYPGEEMLQDTLKSIVVSFFTLAAAFLFLWSQKEREEPLRWHGILWLPVMLCVYALGSMAWSHTYLGGVEAIRWFLFALIAWLGLNLLTRERLAMLAWCVHAGAVAAALWAAAQFWGDMGLFPQGAMPASTFINRNFFAEFVVCTLPFSSLLLARARQTGTITLLAASIGFVIVSILMTGTRAALMALWLQVLVVLPLLAWRCRGQLEWPRWTTNLRLMAGVVLVGTIVGLGMIPSGNDKILQEGRGATPLDRGGQRTRSIGPADESLNIRMVMWKATATMIAARPLSGVGAGAWETDVPLYQAQGSQLETDYYVHNEFLQMVAEYGLVGWAFLLLLLAYLVHAAWRSWRPGSAEAAADQPWRGAALCSLLALLVVCNIGFPWRLATTGALFALCLGALAASDARLGFAARLQARPLRWSPQAARLGLIVAAGCIVLAGIITQRAAESERKLVTAVKRSLSITASGEPNNPKFDPLKREILTLVQEGIAINPHYRKVTPMVADEFARWGDWADATWIWDSVLQSRPNVVAILGNAARGYSGLGQQEKALAYLERAKRIQPNAPTVRSLEVILLARGGKEAQALQAATQAFHENIVDYDLVNSLFILAWRAGDYSLARQALARRVASFPESRAIGLVQMGLLTASEYRDPVKGIEYFRRGLAAASPAERPNLWRQIPEAVRPLLQPAP